MQFGDANPMNMAVNGYAYQLNLITIWYQFSNQSLQSMVISECVANTECQHIWKAAHRVNSVLMCMQLFFADRGMLFDTVLCSTSRIVSGAMFMSSAWKDAARRKASYVSASCLDLYYACSPNAKGHIGTRSWVGWWSFAFDLILLFDRNICLLRQLRIANGTLCVRGRGPTARTRDPVWKGKIHGGDLMSIYLPLPSPLLQWQF